MTQQKYCSKAGLKYRGWTDKAIILFLKMHDKESPNPYYRSAASIKLYLLSHVEEAEKTEAYQQVLKDNEGKRKGCKKAFGTKKAKLLEYVQTCVISVEKAAYAKVVDQSINAYNDFHDWLLIEREHDFTPASKERSEDFLKRITVNHLRHQFSKYDEHIEALFGKVGTQEAYEILSKRIYSEIALAYPQLKDECERQLAGKIPRR